MDGCRQPTDISICVQTLAASIHMKVEITQLFPGQKKKAKCITRMWAEQPAHQQKKRGRASYAIYPTALYATLTAPIFCVIHLQMLVQRYFVL